VSGKAVSASLLPREDARDAALFFVVSALCFLAALSGLIARSAYQAADSWTTQVTGQVSIRIRGDDAALARAVEVIGKTPGVASARALTRDEEEALLKPWLGSASLPTDLPLPKLVAAEAHPGQADVAGAITARLADARIEAKVDDHLVWSADVKRATDSAGLIALAAVGLLGATAVAVIAFATHAALLARREIVEVLHLSGARDRFISSLFEKRFLMLGVQAGTVGALTAFGLAAFILFALKQSADHIWLLPQLSLSLADGLILGLTPLAAGAAAMIAARITVMRSLKEMV
jgi:cell division transport system permease protein